MSQSESDSSELASAIRRILDSGSALLQTRVELFVTELQEEKLRLLDSLLWALIGVALGAMTLIMATATLVMLFWESSPLLVLSLGTLAYGGATGWVFWSLNNKVKASPRPFAGTISELDKDREWLRKKT